MLEQYISGFKNLSTIQLVRRLSRAPRHPNRGKRRSELVWNGIKGAAISQLEGSSVDGPKKLRTVAVWAADNLEPKMVVEEITI